MLLLMMSDDDPKAWIDRLAESSGPQRIPLGKPRSGLVIPVARFDKNHFL
jgi:hypothetical protein